MTPPTAEAPAAGLRVRPEGAGEEHEVAALLTAAFQGDSGDGSGDGGGDGGGEVVAELVASLRRSEWWVDGLSLVAELDGRIVGHLLFTSALLDAPTELVDVLVLSPLAVAPDQQGRGIGSRLLRRGLEVVADRAEPLVFLEGAPGFYPRFGFEPAVPLGFTRPSPRIPEPAFMVVRQPSYRPEMTGALVYPDAFWRHDCVGLRP